MLLSKNWLFLILMFAIQCPEAWQVQENLYKIFSLDQACFIPDSHQKHVWNVCKLRISHVEQGWTCVIEMLHLFHVWKILHKIQAWNFSH